jgi:predicted nucleotidyltransferase
MHAELKIHKAFYQTKNSRMYFNQIKAHTGLSNSSLQNALTRLVSTNLFSKETTSANTFYSIANKKAVALEFARFDLQKFDELNTDVRIPLKELADDSPREIATILLFGSASRKMETDKSDIDLLIVMYDFNDAQLQKEYEREIMRKMESIINDIQSRSIHLINTAFTTTKTLRFPQDHLVDQAVRTGFPIMNQQVYYEVMDHGYP